ncbi:M48 family metallopeptidase [Primorskyibacter sp. S187A]|uniref:M48 family metallopeptidase n=1 Tax=Primorskyibacter sp. S187A TaxID=3415130 RepID=UPI003C7CFB43
MGHLTLSGNPPISIALRRSARARRMTLRISGLDGRITLTLPRGINEREAQAFAAEKEAWLRKHLAKQSAPQRIAQGTSIPIEGRPRKLVAGQGKRITLSDDALTLPLDDGRGGPRLRAWIKAQARQRLANASDHYAAKLGRDYSRITMRDTRSRWGSCSSQRALNYSWRLYMAPPDVLDYVAAHEVAHLAEMNHSPAFWAVVERLYGPHAAQRSWLRTHGNALHTYIFDAQPGAGD